MPLLAGILAGVSRPTLFISLFTIPSQLGTGIQEEWTVSEKACLAVGRVSLEGSTQSEDGETEVP
jgi:hypothetical protein